MTNDISDTDFSELNEQPAEPLAAAEQSAQTLNSHTQDDITNPPQPEENSQMQTSSPRAHEENEDPSYDLHNVTNFIHKRITLLQEFLISLNESEDTNKPLRIMKQKTNGQSKHSNSKETSYHRLPHKLHKAMEFITKQHQLQDKKSYKNYPQSIERIPLSQQT